MRSADRSAIEEDLYRTLRSWRRRAVGAGRVPTSLEWLCSPSWLDQGREVVANALARATAAHGGHPADQGTVGRGNPLVVVTKAPHGCGATATAAIVARCAAFGLHVRRIEQIPPGAASAVAQTLYVDAWVFFRAVPRSDSTWSAIEQKFANAQFETVFGEAFRRSMVLPAADVLRDNDMTDDELADIWNEGRNPIDGSVLSRRYGDSVATLLTGEGSSYDWYRGPWPIGVHRIAPSLFAFALRHERLYAGAPVIVLNGNFLLLSSLFTSSNADDGRCSVIAVTIPAGSATVSQVRSWLIGEYDDPAECWPGTIRHDARDRRFPSASGAPVHPWSNVVHCSDGYLAGLIETRGLLDTNGDSELHARLVDQGYDPEELRRFVLADPVIRSPAGLRHMTQQTKGLGGR